MDPREKAIARILFQNMVHRSDGQAFEDLFTSVMTKANPNFTPIKPQGQIGDRKNDGFDRTTGSYYQVYAPEDLRAKQSDAISKLDEDFTGLKKGWKEVVPIQSFQYVINDKFNGAFPTLETSLAKIKTDHGLRETKPFLTKDLENVLFQQPDDVIFSVIGHIPSPDKIENLHFAAFNDVVNYLVNNVRPVAKTDIFEAPDFGKKIQFNKLGTVPAGLLAFASLQVGAVDKFFELNSQFTKETLKEILGLLYAEAKNDYATYPEEVRSNHIFFEVLHKAYPNGNSQQYQSAILILMAYFFEACDIFEKPEGAA